jgi:hypothetical protein
MSIRFSTFDWKGAEISKGVANGLRYWQKRALADKSQKAKKAVGVDSPKARRIPAFVHCTLCSAAL